MNLLPSSIPYGKATNLWPKGNELENKLECEYGCEHHIEAVQRLCVCFRLFVELHGQDHRVDHDEEEDEVLKVRGRHEPPDSVLDAMLRDVASHRFRLQSEVDAVSLKNRQNALTFGLASLLMQVFWFL